MARKIQRSNMTATDSKGKVIREPRKDQSGEDAKFDWWKDEKESEELAKDIQGTIKFIARHQSSRIEQLTVSTRLYGSNTAYNMLGAAFTRASSINSNPSSQRISYNLCSSVVDTLVSKIAKNKVIPHFLTSGGDWKMQRKAEKLNKFCEGLNYDQKIHSKTVYGFRDAGVWGDGLLHVCRYNDKVFIERVLPHEIFVDIVETLTCDPRQMHRVKIAERSIVKDMFPEYAEQIDKVMPANFEDIGGQGTVADLLTVTESWHLKSGPDAKDGRKVICVGDVVVDDVEYDKDYFPFPHMYYSKRLLGFWGQGACERLQNLQGEINRSMILEQRSRWMQSSFKILVETGSKVVSQHLNNDVGAIIHYTGTPPQYVTPPAIDASNMVYINGLIDKGYKQEGVSTMSAQADKPAGVDSGKALRTLTDIESDRFLFLEQEIEEFVLEVYRQAIEVAKDIYADTNSYEVMFPSGNFMDTVDWKDIDLEGDEYILRAYPTSSLPDDPAGRLQTVQEWMQAGLVSPRVGRRLMAMPDVEMADTLANAAEDLLHKVFEQMLDGDDYRPPEPQMDLQLAKQLYLDYYNYADLHNAPDAVLSKLRQFSSQLDDIMQVGAQPPSAPGMPAGAPMANPTPTPTSPLLPNVNTGASQQ